MPILKQKVFAYITHGHRLLVFRHADFPKAGIQVPAGTVQPDEHPDAAVLREVYEETGLSDFTEVYFLGEFTKRGSRIDRGSRQIFASVAEAIIY